MSVHHEFAFQAQQNFVIQYPQPNGSTGFIWTGDRWMQAPDGVKGHEPQFWTTLQFDTAGRVLPIRWVDSMSVDMKL